MSGCAFLGRLCLNIQIVEWRGRGFLRQVLHHLGRVGLCRTRESEVELWR